MAKVAPRTGVTKDYWCPFFKTRCIETSCRLWDTTNDKCSLVKPIAVDHAAAVAAYVPTSVTIVPSGDMARKAPYDRNPDTGQIPLCNLSVPAGSGWASRASRVIPSGKLGKIFTIYGGVDTAIATAGRMVQILFRLEHDSDAFNIARIMHFSTTDQGISLTVTALGIAVAGDKLDIWTINSDTIAHWCNATIFHVEFDD